MTACLLNDTNMLSAYNQKVLADSNSWLPFVNIQEALLGGVGLRHLTLVWLAAWRPALFSARLSEPTRNSPWHTVGAGAAPSDASVLLTVSLRITNDLWSCPHGRPRRNYEPQTRLSGNFQVVPPGKDHLVQPWQTLLPLPPQGLALRFRWGVTVFVLQCLHGRHSDSTEVQDLPWPSDVPTAHRFSYAHESVRSFLKLTWERAP